MAFDAHANFAISTVTVPPSPNSTGVQVTVTSGTGVRFPTAPFNCAVYPANTVPDATNAEIVRVTVKNGDVFTIVRAQEGTGARSILAGDYIAAAVTAKTLTDIETAIAASVTSVVGQGGAVTGNQILADTAVAAALAAKLGASAQASDSARINGVTVSGTPTVGQVPTAVNGTSATWQTPSGGGAVSSVAGRTGAVVLAEADITGLVTDLAGKAPTLTPAAVATSNTTAAANTIVPVDTTSGNVTITFPTAPADGTRVVVKHVTQGGTNVVSLALGGSDVFNKTGGAATGSLSLLNQAVTAQYKASGAIWYVTGDDLPLSQLDLRYAGLVSPAITGTPTVPTATALTNNTQAASTAYADNSAAAALASATGRAAGLALVFGA